MKQRCTAEQSSIKLPGGCFKGITFLGAVEIKRSLTQLDAQGRTRVIGAGTKKILSRYGRTNYHHHRDERLESSFVGLSPMANYNNRNCVVKISDSSITVEVEDNGVTSSIFEHNNRTISVATVDLNVPTLYCYVANHKKRMLYLFECPDVLATKKVMDATYAIFKKRGSTSDTNRTASLLPKMRRPPPPPLPQDATANIDNQVENATRDNTYLISR